MQFIDRCQLKLIAGNGGDGIIAWRREAHYDKGGPAGGSGGKGGNVILVADHNQSTLLSLKYSKIIRASNGDNGKPDMSSGQNGEDKYIKVPIGTTVYDEDTNEIIVDLVRDKQEFIICNGGKGGRGNAAFKSSTLRAPNLYELGDEGEIRSVRLELKYLANVGIVGYPNAGKSTLISKLSNAKPKIANYQFTTLIPILGMVELNNKRLVFADIPGLIENASEGYGLGHDFLRHVERCEVLIHLISMNPFDHDNVIDAYEKIMTELKKYSQLLVNKKMLVVANKMDAEGAIENFNKIREYLAKKDIDIRPISAINGDVGNLINRVFNLYEKTLNTSNDDNPFSTPSVVEKVYHYDGEKAIDDDPLDVTRDGENRWIVSSKKLTYWFKKIPQTTLDNITRLGQKIKAIGVEDQLKSMGAKPNDVIVICDYEYLIDE
ncbi:GTPase ObgE [Mycoplasma sp. T363T]|uniref:GTPase ObgE n=1 Tax=Mycoplasma bradburyae TaxID=2963128 RepID=UPI00233F7CAA|nr:GTPase ObgE [Mycoplasma bradburyae]MDC4163418.1 GTPase ObgE [Mycoplasma bradburyae]